MQAILTCFFEYKDGHLIWRVPTSRAVKPGDRAGAATARPKRREVKFRGERHYEHRLIWQLIHGDLTDADFIDHIDGDPLNNKIENLRKATNAENQYNQKLSKRNTSGVKGVSWHASRNKWKASIRTVEGRRFKYFNTLEDAAMWVQSQREALHGSFARHE